MQRDSACCQVEPFDALQTRRFHHGFERGLVRVHANRLGEIPVACFIARDQSSKARQNVEAVPVVGRPQRSPDLAEFEDQGDAARLQHASHLGERGVLAGNVAQPEGDADTVEGARRKRQRLGVALDGGQQLAFVEHPVATDRQHCAIDVGENYPAVLPHAISEQPREVGGPARDIQHAGAPPNTACLDGEPLPGAMQPPGHEIVHQVVAGRDRLEHAFDSPRLFFRRDTLETEVRLFAH